MAAATAGDIQEGVRDAKEDEDPPQPYVDEAVRVLGLRLLVLAVVDDAHAELDEEQGDDDEAENLMRGVEPARLEQALAISDR